MIAVSVELGGDHCCIGKFRKRMPVIEIQAVNRTQSHELWQFIKNLYIESLTLFTFFSQLCSLNWVEARKVALLIKSNGLVRRIQQHYLCVYFC